MNSYFILKKSSIVIAIGNALYLHTNLGTLKKIEISHPKNVFLFQVFSHLL